MKPIKNIYRRLCTKILRLSPKKRWALLVFVIVPIAVLWYTLLNKEPASVSVPSDTQVVEILSVGTLSRGGTPLTFSGQVTSRSEANIRTESSGRVTRVHKRLGDAIFAGEIIAEIENAREVAAIGQARAFLAQAKASQNISEINEQSAEILLKETRTSVQNTLRSTYDGIEDAIRNKIDPMFSNPESPSPEFTIKSGNSQFGIDLNFARLKIQSILVAEEKRRGNLSPDNNLLEEMRLTESELTEIKKLIDLVNAVLNNGIATQGATQATIDAHKAIASGVRTSWTALVANISVAKDNFTAKTTQLQVAQKQGKSDIATPTISEASIAQAESSVEIAKVALEKTIIRSPISGTLNSLPVKQGDFVSQLQNAATVSNNGALEIIAYISDMERREIAVGSSLKIQDTAEGTVTRMAPALDPLTKKIEIRIGVLKGLETLLNGQSVNLSISRSKELSTISSSKNRAISIPIVSLKIIPDGPVVFTVEKNIIKSNPVKIGAFL